MGAPRGKLGARRRTDEEDGSVPLPDDSMSEPSVPSDVDDDADGEGSDSSEVDTPNKKQNGHTASVNNAVKSVDGADEQQSHFAAQLADTDVMLNGLTIANPDDKPIEEIHFDDLPEKGYETSGLAPVQEAAETPSKNASLAERRRREHEDYKKRRDADPAFVPNRGGFFMHDQRSSHAIQQNGFGPAMRGRGRGRGGFVGQFEHGPQPEDSPWTHDLHETVAESASAKPEAAQTAGDTAPANQVKPTAQPVINPPPKRDFNRIVQIGNIQLSVFLPYMKDPIVFSAVPARQHTRLPFHRPPLRRDKPVRVSLPDAIVRYVFPAIERSFVFIPRAARPNQQGFGRGRGRGSIGGPGGLRSSKNSMFGGSVYSPSVAMSRRSSFARDRDMMASPAMSVMSRATQPVVRLPHPGTPNQVPAAHFGQQPPFRSGQGHPNYPPPPLYQTIPMYQPQPQKAVTVSGIESPTMNYGPPPQAAQTPFSHQVPPMYGDQNMYALQSRRTSYPSQRGTPLSQIPERAIHAQPFQPYPPYQPMPPPPQQQQQMYYPQQPYPAQPPPNMYYYPPQAPSQPQNMPEQQPYPHPYMMPPPDQQQQPQPQQMPLPLMQPQDLQDQHQQPQPGSVPYESNGMVFYYDQSQLAAEQAAAVAMQPYQGMPYGGMPGQYGMAPQAAMYYPPQ